MLRSALLQITLVLVATDGITFFSIGDWGGAALGQNFVDNVDAVASQMAKTSPNPQFIVNTGDNFYYCGIQNTTDTQIEVDFNKPFAASPLEVPWYSVLGNHEYGYNVEAQIELAQSHSRWVMDARYYTKRVELGSSGHYATLIFLDSSPCVSAYRASDNSGWDPCGSEYPTCSIDDTDDDWEGVCKFHENIMGQDCGAQYTWFQQQLAKVPADDWLFVVGHHPADEMDVADMTSAMQAHGFDLFLNGHAHTLTQYEVDGNSAYVTTGAGSMVSTADQNHAHVQTKVLGGNIPANETSNGHSYSTVWNQKVAGFTTHTFSSDYTQLTTNYITYTGETVHSFTVTRGGAPPGPQPSPTPSPPPGPSGGSCCYSKEGSGSCSAGDVCCKSNCKDPSSCSYTETGCSGEYGKKHNCVWKDNHCVVS